LGKYFSDSLKVLIYVCDASDGRHRERQMLFNGWYKLLPIPTKKHQLEIELEESDAIVHGAVLTRDDFPHQGVLKDELLDKARGILLQKFGQ
jgi:hypothetical protein